ncbi:MAG: carbamoyltransferase [Patescibacteria group bacterium]
MNILGISAYYHDSAACLVKDGNIIAAAQEERFTRIKHDSSFPENAIKFCLKEAKILPFNLDYVVFYDKPFLKFERLLETYIAFAPVGVKSFITSMPVWIKEKLFLPDILTKELNNCFSLNKKDVKWQDKFLFPQHHLSHQASAFFPSPYKEAAILTIDGVGEWATSSLGLGKDNNIELLYETHFPHSLGLLYSAFTYYLGFKVNSGEYKVMGLAPYGEPKYTKTILDNLIDLKEDGSFRLNLKYFNYCTGLTMTNERFNQLFGAKPRKPETSLTQKEMDLARSIQEVTEEAMLRMARFLKKETNQENLCLAGGVALNCVGNGKILKSNLFKNIWVQPASGDAGGALGAALVCWYQFLNNIRVSNNMDDSMNGSFLGPSYSNDDIKDYLSKKQIPYDFLEDAEFFKKAAFLLNQGKVIGWFQGRAEFGPRALGGRSIIADARNSQMQKTLNLKIKFRESFRPFAPSVLGERASDYFELDCESPYMLLVADVQKHHRKLLDENSKDLWGIDKLNLERSSIPAVTHVDYSARIQTVDPRRNERYYKLIKEFERISGCPVIVNTSFNVRGEPIVNSPEDAYRCFMRTNMDYLVLGNYLLDKSKQKPLDGDLDWKKEFKLD